MFSPEELNNIVNSYRLKDPAAPRYVEVLSNDDFADSILLDFSKYCEENKIEIVEEPGSISRSRRYDYLADSYKEPGTFVYVPCHGTWHIGKDKDMALHALSSSDIDGNVSTTYFLSCNSAPASRKALDLFKVNLDSWRSGRLKDLGNKIVEIGSNLRYKIIDFPQIKWNDVILPDDQKNQIQASVDGFFKSKEVYKKLNISWQRGILLIGPPGNGKTMLCRAIASNVKVPFILVRLDSRSSDSEIDEAFNVARKIGPAIICLEDVDRLYAQGSGRASLVFLLNLLDGLTKPNDGILVIGTANHPENIDKALVNRPSRFDRVFRIDPPNAENRKKFLLGLIGKNHGFSEEAISDVITFSKDMAMTYLKEIVTQANLLAVHDGRDTVTDEDLMKALETLKVQNDEAKRDFEKKKDTGFGFRPKDDEDEE